MQDLTLDLPEFVEHPRKTYPHPVSHCQVAVCEQRWIDDDHLSLVANMRRSRIAKLGDAGITTLDAVVAVEGRSVLQALLGRSHG
jgi:predicted RecB family nuclease